MNCWATATTSWANKPVIWLPERVDVVKGLGPGWRTGERVGLTSNKLALNQPSLWESAHFVPVRLSGSARVLTHPCSPVRRAGA